MSAFEWLVGDATILLVSAGWQVGIPCASKHGNSPNDLERLLDDGHTQVRPIVYEAGYIVLGHLGELLLEDTLEAGKDDVRVVATVIIDDSKLNLAISLLDDCRLCVVRQLMKVCSGNTIPFPEMAQPWALPALSDPSGCPALSAHPTHEKLMDRRAGA